MKKSRFAALLILLAMALFISRKPSHLAGGNPAPTPHAIKARFDRTPAAESKPTPSPQLSANTPSSDELLDALRIDDPTREEDRVLRALLTDDPRDAVLRLESEPSRLGRFYLALALSGQLEGFDLAEILAPARARTLFTELEEEDPKNPAYSFYRRQLDQENVEGETAGPLLEVLSLGWRLHEAGFVDHTEAARELLIRQPHPRTGFSSPRWMLAGNPN